jgi:hypothetical protein
MRNGAGEHRGWPGIGLRVIAQFRAGATKPLPVMAKKAPPAIIRPGPTANFPIGRCKKDPASKPADAPLPNPDNYAAMVLNPYGNQENLAPEYIKELEALPERQKNRFLLGKYTAELDNALWTPDSFRHVSPPPEGERERVVVAIDPSGASVR